MVHAPRFDLISCSPGSCTPAGDVTRVPLPLANPRSLDLAEFHSGSAKTEQKRIHYYRFF